MNPIFEAALEIQRVCIRQNWKFCFIGGLAIQRWGEPRFTHDVDLTLMAEFGQEEEFIDTLLKHFKGRLPDAHEFALENRVLLLESSQSIPFDIAFGAIPFEERMIQRASKYFILENIFLYTCSAEDLIVLKAFAAREKDWFDIQGIVTRRAQELDQSQIWQEVLPLFEIKNDTESPKKLKALLGSEMATL